MRKNWSALDKLMISPLKPKVKRSRYLTISKLIAAAKCDTITEIVGA
jgi:hypothetical protein